MEKIRKLGEVEKAVWQILDENKEISNTWNDHGIGAHTSIAAGAAVTEREFPAIAGAIHEAAFSTQGVRLVLPDGAEDDWGRSVEDDRQTERIPAIVNPANAALIEQHFD